MRTPFTYYRRLRERLGDRARALRDLIIDRIFLWHERDRAHANMLFARVDGWALPVYNDVVRQYVEAREVAG